MWKENGKSVQRTKDKQDKIRQWVPGKTSWSTWLFWRSKQAQPVTTINRTERHQAKTSTNLQLVLQVQFYQQTLVLWILKLSSCHDFTVSTGYLHMLRRKSFSLKFLLLLRKGSFSLTCSLYVPYCKEIITYCHTSINAEKDYFFPLHNSFLPCLLCLSPPQVFSLYSQAHDF